MHTSTDIQWKQIYNTVESIEYRKLAITQILVLNYFVCNVWAPSLMFNFIIVLKNVVIQVAQRVII